MLTVLALAAGTVATGVDGPGQAAESSARPAAANAEMDPVTAAELLLAAGHPEEARKLLTVLADEQPANLQVRFLLGLADLQLGKYSRAIEHFRKITNARPDNVRTRLEMGRAYFLAGDYANADRQFRFARAGDLPPAVLRNIDGFLKRIRQLKRFSFDFSLALAPDTNLNAGPAIDTISLYGIPFQLDESARRQSGIGLSVQGGLEWSLPVAPAAKMRIGLRGNRSQYRDSAFNDMTGLAYAGPHFTFARWDLDVYAVGQRRWYGDRRYMDAFGGSIAATRYLSTRTALSATLTRVEQRFARLPDQSGAAASLSLALVHVPTSSSAVSARISAGRQSARAPAYANRNWQLGLSYSREFSGGLTVAVAPSLSAIDYRAPIAAFGRTRRDRQLSVSASILSRRIYYRGFSPKLIYTYTNNFSNIDLYSFERHRIEFAITREF